MRARKRLFSQTQSEPIVHSSVVNIQEWAPNTNKKIGQRNGIMPSSVSFPDPTKISEAFDQDDLVGDWSKKFCLPKTKQTGLAYISVHTMAKLINGEYSDTVNSYRVIDCRYPYEFQGGHIVVVENLYAPDHMLKILMDAKTKNQIMVANESKRDIIFHCEFSSKRGPKLASFLRENDRLVSTEYPDLYYPEMYILEGGYFNFFKHYKKLCFPQSYVPMNAPEYKEQYKQYRTGNRSWNGDK